MRFYLGTHRDNWLADDRFRDVPLFVSHRRLKDRKRLPAAVTDWALDSGGFSELSLYDEWRTTPSEYIAAVRRYADGIGRLQWAAPQDWMCEPHMLAKTGKTVAEHQRLTVENLLELRHAAPDLPFVPVLQGWDLADYLRHADAYAKAGIDLTAEPVVGLGSVCRRQHTEVVEELLYRLAARDITAVHGFGFKAKGLERAGHMLGTADSMAWSYAARRRPPLPGCSGHINCANCASYALRWRERLLGNLPTWHQPTLALA